MSRAELTVRIAVDAPQAAVWDAVTDWPRQSEWMVATKVWLVEGDGRSIGSRIAARTGLAGIGLPDSMTITKWDPPHRVQVLHDGAVLRGPGDIEVRADGNRSILTWSEDLELPFGPIGRLGWPIARPAVRAGFERSLRALARSVEREIRT